MTHSGYILAAYGFTGLVVLGLIVWSLAEYRSQRRALEALEAKLGRTD